MRAVGSSMSPLATYKALHIRFVGRCCCLRWWVRRWWWYENGSHWWQGSCWNQGLGLRPGRSSSLRCLSCVSLRGYSRVKYDVIKGILMEIIRLISQPSVGMHVLQLISMLIVCSARVDFNDPIRDGTRDINDNTLSVVWGPPRGCPDPHLLTNSESFLNPRPLLLHFPLALFHFERCTMNEFQGSANLTAEHKFGWGPVCKRMRCCPIYHQELVQQTPQVVTRAQFV